MLDPSEKSELDDALLSVWRQALVEGAKRVHVEDDTYPVRRTAKSKLAQVDFEVAGQPIRGLQQNPATRSRWADMARKGGKVMQFLIGGRYIAAVSDGKLTKFGGAFDGSMQHHLGTNLFKGGVYDPRKTVATFPRGKDRHLAPMEVRAVPARDWARLWQATSHHSQAVVAKWRHSSRRSSPLAVGTHPSRARRHLTRNRLGFVDS